MEAYHAPSNLIVLCLGLVKMAALGKRKLPCCSSQLLGAAVGRFWRVSSRLHSSDNTAKYHK
eukprot:scaffold381905_cov33-Prasinocladus_malaysianus.AAC.1